MEIENKEMKDIVEKDIEKVKSDDVEEDKAADIEEEVKEEDMDDEAQKGNDEEMDYDSEDSLDAVISSVRAESKGNKDLQDQDGKKKKVYKKGIIYLSFIPPLMSITKLVQLMSQYGKVGRVFLQPAENSSGKKAKKKKIRKYSEGWIEFMKKRVAKQVALNLNNQCIGGKKGDKYHDYIWNIKYLPRFKWIHLSERLSYERAVYRQRMQTEVNQARRVASQFMENVEMAEKLKKKKKQGNPENIDAPSFLPNQYTQKETDSVKKQKSEFQKKKQSREDFLKNIFS